MPQGFDAIVIGSGFGGAVMACRLAEKGMRVLVLERGRRWTPREYPRKPGDAWLFNPAHPARLNGWLDLRFFRHMTVAQGAGVGGGSLVYSNVALEVNPAVFTNGWPADITYAELKPWYDRVSGMMNLQTIPDGQLTARSGLVRQAAEGTGHGGRLVKTPLAVSFSPAWNYDLPDPFDPRHSTAFTNAQGQQQGTCIHLGNCGIGCDVRAKNTLDLNYLARAEQLGADIRPLHVVRAILPYDGRYRVVFDRVRGGELVRGEESASHVCVAAGSLGSTELLLRCRDEHRTLPRLGRHLGQHWTGNANVLSFASYADADRVRQTVGPPISSMIDFMDGQVDGQRFVVEDDGLPDLLTNALRACVADPEMRTDIGRSLFEHIATHVRGTQRARNLMVWLGSGLDAADGQLTLRHSLRDPSRLALDLAWRPESAAAVVGTMLAVHRRLTDATGGRLLPNLAWSLFRNLITLQPLGGCRIGERAESGVVDHLGRVFGYPNLYVADGAILPSPVGRNPSHTIAALAERVAAHVR